MRLRFRIQTSPSATSTEIVDRVVEVEPAGDEVRIGRRAGVEIQLPFATVSSVHARVFRHGGGWALIDMGSSNGSFIGQNRLASGQPHVIKPGQGFRLADVTITFEGETGSPGPEEKSKTESTATLARRLVNDLFQAVAGAEIARVVVDKGPSAGQSLPLALPDRPYKVGRAPDCDLVLSDDDVSREHAAFERRWQGVFVRDLGSKNGVEIDGEKIRGERRVHDGEIMKMGQSVLRIDDPEERYLRQMEADAREAPKRNVTVPSAPAPAVAAKEPEKPAPAPAAKEPEKPVPAAAKEPEKPAPAPAAKEPEKPAAAKPAEAPKPAAKPPEPAKPAPAEAARSTDKDKPAAKPTPAKVAVKPAPKAPDKGKSKGKGKAAAPSSRVLPFFVTIFSLAVLGGVGYLIWVILYGMTEVAK